jgi:hypothetical protein
MSTHEFDGGVLERAGGVTSSLACELRGYTFPAKHSADCLLRHATAVTWRNQRSAIYAYCLTTSLGIQMPTCDRDTCKSGSLLA